MGMKCTVALQNDRKEDELTIYKMNFQRKYA